VPAALKLKVSAAFFATGWAAGSMGGMRELGAPVSGSGLGELPGISWIPGRTFNARIEFMVTTSTLRQVKLQYWITSGMTVIEPGDGVGSVPNGNHCNRSDALMMSRLSQCNHLSAFTIAPP
jgi:hypothetical protein